MKNYTLNVNGETHQVTAEAEMPLLWVLRDLLGMKGTKFGCGQGLCGACTVQLDGAPIRSCSTYVEDAEGAKITTVEGLNGNLAEQLRQAWVDESVPQCGYCQSGQTLAAEALLRENPNPSDEDIETAMNGHICRCGTYGRIKKAIRKVAAA